MIRRRLLRAVGWTVISVPYHAWYALAPERRTPYMARLLVRKDRAFTDQVTQVRGGCRGRRCGGCAVLWAVLRAARSTGVT